MVEDHRLDVRVAPPPRDRRGATPTWSRRRSAAEDRLRLQPRGLNGVELVRVQAVELADIAVQRALDRNDRVRMKPPSGERRSERIEIRVSRGSAAMTSGAFTPNCCLGGLVERRSSQKRASAAQPAFRQALLNSAMASISTLAPEEAPQPPRWNGPAAGRQCGARRPRSWPRSRRNRRGKPSSSMRSSPEPASSRIACRLSNAWSVCSTMPSPTISVSPGWAHLARHEDEPVGDDRLRVRRRLGAAPEPSPCGRRSCP